MYLLCFYVPESHKESVKQAIFKAGGGKFKHYDMCSFESMGLGQFRPLEKSSPFIGSVMKVETVTEYKVEMICEDQLLEQAIAALKKAHPYEEPAYHAISIEL